MEQRVRTGAGREGRVMSRFLAGGASWSAGWRWGCAGLSLKGGTAREQAERSRSLVEWVAEPGQHIVSLAGCMHACMYVGREF